MGRKATYRLLAGLVLLSLLALGCAQLPMVGGDQTPTPEQRPTVTSRPTVTVRRGSIVETVKLIGRVAAAREADLYFEHAGRLKNLSVKTGDEVAEGAVIAEIDTGDLEERIALAQAALETAQVRLDQARAQSKSKDLQRKSDLAAAQLAVQRAEADLQKAQADVEAAKAGPSLQEKAQAAVREAQYALDTAKRNLIVVQKSPVVSRAPYDRQNEHNWYEVNYGQQEARYNRGEIDKAELERHWQNLMAAKERLDSARAEAASALAQAEENVVKAEEALRKAQADLAAKLALPPDAHIKEAERGVLAAQIALDKAKADYELKQVAGEDYELKLLEKEVARAKTSLDQLLAERKGSALVAPFAGRVIAARGRIGDQVVAYQPVAIVADPTSLIIRGELMDSDIPKVMMSQPVTVTVDAMAGLTLNGKVAGIPSKLGEQGSIDRSVQIEVEWPRPGQLGALARISIEVQRKDNVLIVSTKAVKTVGKRRFVEYMEGDLRRSANVEVGVATETEAEIVEGLREGQVILAGQ